MNMANIGAEAPKLVNFKIASGQFPQVRQRWGKKRRKSTHTATIGAKNLGSKRKIQNFCIFYEFLLTKLLTML